MEPQKTATGLLLLDARCESEKGGSWKEKAHKSRRGRGEKRMTAGVPADFSSAKA
jgi:hypothetical protein